MCHRYWNRTAYRSQENPIWQARIGDHAEVHRRFCQGWTHPTDHGRELALQGIACAETPPGAREEH